MSDAPIPADVRLGRAGRLLTLGYPDGNTFELPAELLRVFSPSAEVRGHGPGQRKLQTGKKHVAITGIEPVGHYALRLTFDDGHDTGIYTWAHLHDLGTRRDHHWRQYQLELQRANASRLPPIEVGTWRPE